MSKRACNVLVKAERGESSENLIKRFFKKCKKQGILQEYYDRFSHAKTRSQKKREKRRDNARLREIQKFKHEQRLYNKNNNRFR